MKNKLKNHESNGNGEFSLDFLGIKTYLQPNVAGKLPVNFSYSYVVNLSCHAEETPAGTYGCSKQSQFHASLFKSASTL